MGEKWGLQEVKWPIRNFRGSKRQSTSVKGKDHASGDEGCVVWREGEQTALLTLKMKKSSMNMAPKGRIPAMRMLQQNRRVNIGRRPSHWKPRIPP